MKRNRCHIQMRSPGPWWLGFWWLVLISCSLVLGCSNPAAEKQQRRIDTLRELGAGVDFNSQGAVTFINLSHKSVADDQLVCVTGLVELKQLWLYDTRITDRGLQHLRDLPRLEVLVLGKTDISDQGLMQLTRCSSLKEIYLNGTNVSDYAVDHLQAMMPETSISF